MFKIFGNATCAFLTFLFLDLFQLWSQILGGYGWGMHALFFVHTVWDFQFLEHAITWHHPHLHLFESPRTSSGAILQGQVYCMKEKLFVKGSLWLRECTYIFFKISKKVKLISSLWCHITRSTGASHVLQLKVLTALNCIHECTDKEFSKFWSNWRKHVCVRVLWNHSQDWKHNRRGAWKQSQSQWFPTNNCRKQQLLSGLMPRNSIPKRPHFFCENFAHKLDRATAKSYTSSQNGPREKRHTYISSVSIRKKLFCLTCFGVLVCVCKHIWIWDQWEKRRSLCSFCVLLGRRAGTQVLVWLVVWNKLSKARSNCFFLTNNAHLGDANLQGTKIAPWSLRWFEKPECKRPKHSNRSTSNWNTQMSKCTSDQFQ